MKTNYSIGGSFLAGMSFGFICAVILLLSFNAFNKDKSESEVPTATVVEFEDEPFIVFYDSKGQICGIYPYNDEMD